MRFGFRSVSVLLAMLLAVGISAPQSAAQEIAGTQISELPGFTLYRLSDGAEPTGPAPVIIWGNGACSLDHRRWLPIIRRLANDGYVVLATGRPGAVPANEDGGAQPRYTDADLERAVDWAHAANATGNGPYAGSFDLEKLALAGNSCGGITSVALASRDARIHSIFILSGGSIGPFAERADKAAVMGTIRAPLLYVVGGQEDFAHDPAFVDFDLLPDGTPMAIIARNAGDHGFVSVTPAIVTQAAEMASLWFAGTLHGDGAAIDYLTNSVCSTCAPDVWSMEKQKYLKPPE